MADDPLDAMKWRWSYIQGYLFPSMREDIDPITEALGRLVTTLDVIGLRAFVAKAVLGVPTTSALIERLAVDKSLRRILGFRATLASSFRSHLFPGVRRIRTRRAARQDPRRADRACARGTHHRGDRARRHRDRSAREAGPDEGQRRQRGSAGIRSSPAAAQARTSPQGRTAAEAGADASRAAGHPE